VVSVCMIIPYFRKCHKVVLSLIKNHKADASVSDCNYVFLQYRFWNNEVLLMLLLYRNITFTNHLQNFIQHPAVKVNSICEGNYRGSSMWISTQQVDY